MAIAAFIPAITSVIGVIGNGIKGIFSLKNEQANLVKESIKLIDSIQDQEAKAKVAAMTALVAESQSESFLTRVWRPLAFLGFLGLLFMYFFGYAPANALGPELPPIIDRIFNILEIVLLAGYPARTIDKIARQISFGKIIQTFIDKKIL